jgi:cytochrome c oxidase cbb3-type subunit 4
MGLEQIFDNASSIMTVISFTTFVGILVWTFALHRNRDFAAQAALPFADEAADNAQPSQEARHV